MDLIDRFPSDASGGVDFFSGLGVREFVTVDDEGREVRRPERVLALGRFFAYGDPPPGPGRVCITETTARAIGNLVGMYAPAEYHRQLAKLRAYQRDNDALSMRVAGLERQVEVLRDDAGTTSVIYVAPDGTEHGSKAALARHMTIPQEVTT